MAESREGKVTLDALERAIKAAKEKGGCDGTTEVQFNISCMTGAERDHGSTFVANIWGLDGRFIFDIGSSDQPGGGD